ncbi:MAG TPA: NUDIX hydrolase [Tepidisphaeraceae bacterium]|nr:NUDIX hydrolase [Tepidisphaeraceae bacterium]
MAEDVLWEGKWLRVQRRGSWDYVTRPGLSGVVGIVAVTDDRKIVLVEQFRPPVNANVIELPAGLAGDGEDAGEDLAVAAKRELLEETGYEAREMRPVARGVSSAGMSDEVIDLFHATGLRKSGSGGGVADEKVTLHEVPLGELKAWVDAQQRAGKLIDLKVLTAAWVAGVA